jgi:hypothetical protein
MLVSCTTSVGFRQPEDQYVLASRPIGSSPYVGCRWARGLPVGIRRSQPNSARARSEIAMTAGFRSFLSTVIA